MLTERAARLASTVLGLVENRMELMALELREEQGRMVGYFVLGGLVLALCLLAAVVAAFGILLILPPHQRVAGAFIMAGGCLVLAGLAFAWLRWRINRSPGPFAATRMEFRKDREFL